MKKFLLVVAISLASVLATSDALAQKSGCSHGFKAKSGVIMGGARLNLSEDQKSKARAIVTEHAREVRELKTVTGIDRQTRMQRLAALRDKARTSYRNILTPEQLNLLDQSKSKAKDAIRKRITDRRKL